MVHILKDVLVDFIKLQVSWK